MTRSWRIVSQKLEGVIKVIHQPKLKCFEPIWLKKLIPDRNTTQLLQFQSAMNFWEIVRRLTDYTVARIAKTQGLYILGGPPAQNKIHKLIRWK